MSELSGLVDAAGSAAALRAYMSGGEFKRTLSIVGDIHFIAAEEALSGAGTRETRADIREARAHLRAAHVAYRQIYDFRFRPIFYLATKRGPTDTVTLPTPALIKPNALPQIRAW